MLLQQHSMHLSQKTRNTSKHILESHIELKEFVHHQYNEIQEKILALKNSMEEYKKDFIAMRDKIQATILESL